ncbi:MAG: DNA repair protein RadA [Actinomycetota bacterium]
MKGSARTETLSYVCQDCLHHSVKWMGFCPQCKSKKALVEESSPRNRRSPSSIKVVSATERSPDVADRRATGITEFDRVIGGGIVPGVAILVGGEPGVGKSTLLLQVADQLASGGDPVLVATAEESTHQVQMRARRIGVQSSGVSLASVNDVDDIIALATQMQPAAVVVDSIQTISSVEVSGSAGGTSQVRECAGRLIEFSKRTGVPVVLVGHVTKDGSIAGPRTLEHMVDVVLYLEGELDRGLRFLRGIKNRFGTVNEVGVFEMTQDGLAEVADPSGLMVAHRNESAPGTILFPTIEGKRPLVVEIQALVVRSEAPQPRRAVSGVASARVHQILGVLERHLLIPLRRHEVYVSVMGGMKVTEPAADLPIALAIVSAYFTTPLAKTAAWGELGLTGDVRPVSRPDVRRSEAERLAAGPVIAPGEGFRRLMEAVAGAGLLDEVTDAASSTD